MESDNFPQKELLEKLKSFVQLNKPNINADLHTNLRENLFWIDHYEIPHKEEEEFLQTPEAQRIVSLIKNKFKKTKDDSTTRTEDRSNPGLGYL
ncbi:hypothetical protein [uncultured Chryseobacterium sp.]|uniref:hypothetical protein n=1 Tax=uncultured Chryseobacterium sp. TaxID=259322 RepID=UPI0025E9625F|nr:hypothetical protein [uncultured Chryseobacterium sp.]